MIVALGGGGERSCFELLLKGFGVGSSLVDDVVWGGGQMG